MDHRADGKTWGRRRVIVPLGIEVNVIHWDPPHRGIYKETTCGHSGKGGLPPIYDTCTEVEQIMRTSWMVQWWDQDAVNEPEE